MNWLFNPWLQLVAAIILLAISFGVGFPGGIVTLLLAIPALIQAYRGFVRSSKH